MRWLLSGKGKKNKENSFHLREENVNENENNDFNLVRRISLYTHNR